MLLGLIQGNMFGSKEIYICSIGTKLKSIKVGLNSLESKVIMMKTDEVLPAEIFWMNTRKYFWD